MHLVVFNVPNSAIILVPPDHAVAPSQSAEQGGTWHIGDSVNGVATWAAVPAGEDAAASIAKALQRRGHARKPVVLALPSSWCLAATIPTAGLPRGDHKALLYRLEERLPLAAEAVVADFIPAPTGDTALGVCSRIDRLRPCVDALEAAGVTVRSIVPLSLLIAVGAPISGPASARTTITTRLLVCAPGLSAGHDLIALHGRDPIAWTTANGAESDLARRTDWLAAILGTDFSVERLGVPGITTAALAGAAMHGTSNAATIDLRRDALAPADRLRAYHSALRAVAAAAIVLFSAVAFAAFVRAGQFQQAARDAEAQTLSEVRTAFPAAVGSASDGDIRTLLAQERRSWANHSAAGGGAVASALKENPGATKTAVAGGSALRTLRDVIKLLPDNADVRIDTTMFGETMFQLTGRARSYDDIEKFASAIRTGHPEVSVSQARRGTDGQWSFTLGGATIAATAAR